MNLRKSFKFKTWLKILSAEQLERLKSEKLLESEFEGLERNKQFWLTWIYFLKLKFSYKFLCASGS